MIAAGSYVVFQHQSGRYPNFAEIAACESPRRDFQRSGNPITFGGAREAVSGGRSGLAC